MRILVVIRFGNAPALDRWSPAETVAAQILKYHHRGAASRYATATFPGGSNLMKPGKP